MLVPALALGLAASPALFDLGVDAPILAKKPTYNGTHIVFCLAGDLWSVPKAGGQAVRLTTGIGVEDEPYFSPDGKTLAFSAQYDGNLDVYTMPAAGGIPRRLTFSPSGEGVRGWTPDGKGVLMMGPSPTYPFPALFTVSTDAKVPEMLPFPEGHMGSFSPDGTQIAYVPKFQFQDAWKRYRGGQTFPIWIGNLSDSKVTEIPRDNSNDFNPMWVGSKIYFLSDRDGKTEMFSYDLGTKRTTKVVPTAPDGFDIKAASAGPGAIVFERFGSIHLLDTASGRVTDVPIEISADFREARSRYVNAAGWTSSASVSPSGLRVAVTARGEVFDVPTGKGETANLTETSGANDRWAAFSPDGKWLAWFSDESGNYQLVLHEIATGTRKTIAPESSNGFYYLPHWSPDGKKIAFSNESATVLLYDVDTGRVTVADNDPAGVFFGPPAISWSPDSKWITYVRSMPNHLGAVYVYNVAEGKRTRVTDGMSDAISPAFDRNGKYLYFLASTDSGRNAVGLDMSSIVGVNTSYNGYVVVLRNDLPSPLAPEDEREGVEAPKPTDDSKDVRIDFDGIDQRILALPLPRRNYGALTAGPAGAFFVLEIEPIGSLAASPGSGTVLHKFDLASKATAPFARNIQGYDVSSNGTKILLQTGPMIQVVPTAAPPAPGQGAVDTSKMQMHLDPRKEWKQIFREALNTQRDFFYAPNYHGQDLAALNRKYAPFLETLMSREDLNYVLIDMLGEICVGHMYIGGGDMPNAASVPAGLLGADYDTANGRYRFKRVLSGENWNPNLRAPLTQPGVNVKAGEYLIAVNGRNVTDQDNIYAVLENKANRQVKLKVGSRPDGSDAREVVVVPVASEGALRTMAWVEDNRRKVEKLSGGKLGYVYLPDTGLGGFNYFNRYYFAQVGKEGMIIDERYNGGGLVADWIVDMMQRPLRSYWTGQIGMGFTSPGQAVFGPKVMITNEYGGSGGDYLPWLFRQAKVGPVVGKRTWGGLVGIGGTPQMVDGGMVTSPSFGMWNPNGTWDVENYGSAPDIEVEMDPALWRLGRDPQLERAVQECLDLLAKNPLPTHTRPAWPDKRKPEKRGG